MAVSLIGLGASASGKNSPRSIRFRCTDSRNLRRRPGPRASRDPRLPKRTGPPSVFTSTHATTDRAANSLAMICVTMQCTHARARARHLTVSTSAPFENARNQNDQCWNFTHCRDTRGLFAQVRCRVLKRRAHRKVRQSHATADSSLSWALSSSRRTRVDVARP